MALIKKTLDTVKYGLAFAIGFPYGFVKGIIDETRRLITAR